MLRLALVSAAAVLISACGGGTLASFCRRTADVTCQKLYECTPDVAAQNGYTNVADCVTKRQASCTQLDDLTCTGIDTAAFDQCLDDTRKATCSASLPASCETAQAQLTMVTCSSPDGRIMCSNGSIELTATGCTETRSRCGDGKNYSVTCTSGTCTCAVDGIMGKTYSGSCGNDSATLNTNCGWNLR